ncbi:MAG: glycosyltransferase [Candidatus Omnitrophota bacterium]|nr:glycosyltransferase [Candidatus Omnitrophota bacterium]
MYNPLVSVTIPAYNAQNFIERTILSAINQTYKNIEVIVLDDGSNDNTGDIVGRLQKKDNRVRYYYQKNQGLASSRNRLCELSQGAYIAFLDHDDEWFPEKLELQLELFRGKPGIALVFTDMLSVYEDKAECSFRYFSKRQPQRGKVFYEFLLGGNFIPLSSVAMRTDLLKDYLPFRLSLKIAEEWELFLRISRDYDFDYLDKPLGIYHLHSSRASKDVLLEVNERLEIMDYWYKKEEKLRSYYRNKFLKAKSDLNLQRAYFYKHNQKFKQGVNEIVNCIRIYPLSFEFYLKLIKYFLLFISGHVIKLINSKIRLIKQ